MIGFDVFAAYYKTMNHRGMQAGLVAVTTGIYARLHVDIVHVVFSSKVMCKVTCIQCSLPERKGYRHELHLRKRYVTRKEASVRYRTLSYHPDLC
ncbi:hypothetical protein [Nitrosomonas sp.]|uniref:hypothetical protein n=1 Tax=Nitrosomonas sp. TaxID=42353 RepID=UPI00261F158B|nr:hypothetical protein [Nitrosomonas sp.]MCW5601367.1 hypothetical protein [Nitrosomonas sp.]MCW5601409.1 hypothetical protein [Nitrosomonas sp.]